MLLQQKHQPVGMTPGLETRALKIKASPKAFQILTSGLYTDKIKAVIREISTNAYDSHLANHNADEPFEVHLPTELDPTFYVRDFGVGITPEEIDNVYTVLFESTKTEDEDATGCLGLGCKSPFSYKDSFTVESFRDGKQYVYSFHLDEFGAPSSTPLGEFPTKERNGVKVSISVDAEHIRLFKLKAAEVFKYFSVLPKFTGSEITIEKTKPQLSGDGWESYGNNRVACAVMANVAYPITADQYFTSEENNLINYFGLQLNFKNGEVSFDAGREKLTHDKKTIANIKAKLALVQEAVLKDIQAEIDKCVNRYEAKKLFRKLSQNNDYVTKLSSLIKYKGGPVDYSCRHDDIPKGVTIRTLDVNINRVKDRNWIYIGNEGDIIYLVDDNSEWKRKIRNEYTNHIASGNYNTYFVVSFADAAAEAEFCKWMGFDASYIVKLSSIPKPPKTQRIGGGGMNHMDKVNLYKENTRTTFCWTPVEVDFDSDEGIYVEILSGKVIMPKGYASHASVIEEYLRYIEKLTGKRPQVYGVKRKHAEDLVDNPDWVTLWDYASELINEFIQNDKDLEDAVSHLENDINWIIEEFLKKVKLVEQYINPNGDFKALNEAVEKRKAYEKKNYNSKIDTLKNLARLMDQTVKLVSKPIDYDKMLSDIKEKYPLFVATDCNRSGRIRDHIVYYINQIEKGELV